MTSEEQAYRAAEATYRSYVAALNEVDLADPATFEPVYVWLSNDSLAASKSFLGDLHKAQRSLTGETVLARFTPTDVTPSGVLATVCLDVSSVDVLDAEGSSVVSSSRPSKQSLQVTFERSSTSPTGLSISASAQKDGLPC